jgi:hypothetical protein
MRVLFLSSLVVASASAAGAPQRPAAVQVCFEVPAGAELFSSAPRPHFRALSSGTWMLDFDLRLDGEAPQRVTKAGPSCVRAWLPPRRVREVTLSFARIPLNYAAVSKQVDLKLKPDLWFDAGTVAVAQQPFAVAHRRAPGELVFERKTADGLVREQPDALPIGEYVVTWTPAPERHACTTRLEVVTMGSVSKEKDPALFAELTAHYEATQLPRALELRGLACTDAEEVHAEVLLVDGAFVRPLQPKLVKVAVPSKEPVFQLRHAGGEVGMEGPVTISIGSGDVLELVATPPSLATR